MAADIGHEPLIVRDVVNRQKYRSQHLSDIEQVPDCAAAEIGTAVARAVYFDRRGIVSVGRVSQPQCAVGGKREGVSAISRRQDAVKHIDSGPDGGDNIGGHSDTHQVSRPVGGQQRGRVLDGGDHEVVTFADAEAANGVAVEIHRHEFFGTSRSQVAVDAALDDGEEQLAVACMDRFTFAGPADGPLDGFLKPVRFARVRRTFVETHDNVGAERILRSNSRFSIQVDPRPIDVTCELYAVFADAVQGAQRKDLVSAAVGEDGAVPCHEAVEAAEAADCFGAGAEHEVVSVGEDHFGSGVAEVLWGEAFYGAARAYGHEGRRLDVAVGCGERAPTCTGVVIGRFDCEAVHVGISAMRPAPETISI